MGDNWRCDGYKLLLMQSASFQQANLRKSGGASFCRIWLAASEPERIAVRASQGANVVVAGWSVAFRD